MKIQLMKYQHKSDFIKIREFLISSYKKTNQPLNWTFERWNYAFYFVRDMFEMPVEDWSDRIGIWENEKNEIVSLVLHEAVNRGETFFQINPDYANLAPLEEMFEFAENKLPFKEKGRFLLRPRIREGNLLLEKIAEERGYKKREDAKETTSEIFLDRDLSYTTLPEGYQIKSMAEENNIEKRTLAFAKAFGNYGTDDEVQPSSYVELQKCPDYHLDLDVFVKAPNNDFVSFCLIWYDELNKIGILEPVGTDPNLRKKGLAKAAVYEAMNRVKDKGAKKVYVGDGQQFYMSIGFEKKYIRYVWEKEIS